MNVAYFDCFSGISGNMILGALIDAGLELDGLRAELGRLPLSGYTLTAKSVQRGGMHGTYVEVEAPHEHVHRHLRHIEEIIGDSDLAPAVKEQGLAIFTRLAQAEARVHGAPVESVHFHEVGAVDAIVDVMGAVIGLNLLEVERVYASPVHVGRGTVECAHGTLPVPAPATMELLQGVPIYGRDVEAELVTPTGAAILTTVTEAFGRCPPMTVERIGYGAGSRELSLPNLLRLSVGREVDLPGYERDSTGGGTSVGLPGYEQDTAVILETNIDDMNPQWYEHVSERLFEAGVLDVFLTPIHMKRGRPATRLSVLVEESGVSDVLAILFAETTTIGVRAHPVRRWKLHREVVSVDTPYGPVDVKVSRRGDELLNIAPEYRDCRRLAVEHDVPIKEVHREALVAARALSRQG